MPAGEEPLLDALERWLRSTTGVVVPREAWDWSKVARTCSRPTGSSTTAAPSRRAARTWRRSRRRCGRSSSRRWRRSPPTPAWRGAARRPGRSATLDESATLTRAGHRVTVFPALVDEGATVGLGVFGSTDEAEARHRLGVRRLLLLALALPVGRGAARRAVHRRAARAGRVAVRRRRGAAGRRARGRGRRASVDAAPPVRSQEAYDALLGAARAAAPDGVRALLAELLRVLDGWRQRRQGAQRPRGDDAAAGARGHEGAARAAGARRASSARPGRSSCAATRPTSGR